MINATKNTASQLSILSSNVRGFGDLVKQKKMISHYEKTSPDLICLSDTRLNENKKLLFRNNYGKKYKIFFCSFEGNARGTLIMVSKKTPITIENEISDDDGNMNAICFKYDGKIFALCAVYGPNTDDPGFFENIFEKVYLLNAEYNIFTGDFNTAPSHALDYENYRNIIHPRARTALNDIFIQYNCTDAYRVLNGNNRDFTWRAEGVRQQMARLDLCLISNNLVPYLKESTIRSAYLSDHDYIVNKIDFHKVKRGKGYWKFQNDLLDDNEYVMKIIKTIHETLAKYVKTETYDNFLQECTNIELQNFMALSPEELCDRQYCIDPNMLLEMLINDIRLESIGYMAAKRKIETERASYLYKEISNLRQYIINGTISPADKVKFDEYNTEYDEILENKAHKIMLRDKTLNKIAGEKASKFFCNLESDKACEKFIPVLKIAEENGDTSFVRKQERIEEEITSFYKNLYSNKDSLLNNESIENFLGIEQGDVHPKINDHDAEPMGVPITISEMKNTLDKGKKSSAPGLTGLTYEFYSKFWNYLGFFLVDAANYSWTKGALPESLSRGIISLLPKEDKSRDSLSNWRPLTMLSTEYKLISGCIARRIGKVMPNIISEDQNGFISGRYIGESIRTVYDTLHYAKVKKITGMLLLVDFSKAFDSLSHSFILKCLNFFRFNDATIKWIKILIENFKASTIHAGNISESFILGRGSKQGDPVSSLLFVLCVEILSLKISKEITGLKIGRIRVKKTLYADDLTVILEYSESELRKMIKILKDFYRISGLEINQSKTQAVVFGNIPAGNYKLCRDIDLTWKQNFKLLGIKFDAMLEKMHINYDEAIDKVKETIKNWRYRLMTVYGKAVITKTLLLSKFAHLHLVLPDLPAGTLDSIETMIYLFLWKGKTDVVARNDAKLAEIRGGLNLPDIAVSINALKIGWFRRGYSKTNSTWVAILNETLHEWKKGLSLQLILTSTSLDEINLVRLQNPFWSSCFKKLVPPSKELINKTPKKIIELVIWGSRLIEGTERRMNRRFNSDIADNIHTIADTLKIENGSLHFKEDALLVNCEQPDIAKLANFKLVIKRFLAEHQIVIGEHYSHDLLARPSMPILIQLIRMSERGCRAWSDLLKNRSSAEGIRLRETGWERKLGMNLGVKYWDACYLYIKQINFNNRLKWFHYTVVRGCLQVNRIVAKFKTHVSELCTFCGNVPESTEHLLFQCPISFNFIRECLSELEQFGVNIDINNIEIYDFLFLPRSRLRNFKDFVILLHIKHFVWLSRCRGNTPDVHIFLQWLKKEFLLLSNCIDTYPKLQFVTNISALLNE